MSFLIDHDTFEVERELDKDGELEFVVNGMHGDDDRHAWINKKQAEDLIEKVKNAFDI